MDDSDSTNLVLEQSERFQAGQDRTEREPKEIKGRMSQVEIGIASIRCDLARMSGDQASQTATVDTLAERIDRIERPLELTG